MNVGQRVRVQVYGGEIVERVIHQIIENIIFVTTENEYEQSQAEGRPVMSVGYRIEDVGIA
jgi:hypothetical protein